MGRECASACKTRWPHLVRERERDGEVRGAARCRAAHPYRSELLVQLRRADLAVLQLHLE
eukprot:5189166-Prymnesium_polylepis.1